MDERIRITLQMISDIEELSDFGKMKLLEQIRNAKGFFAAALGSYINSRIKNAPEVREH